MNNKRGFNDIAINNSKFTGGLITGPAIILGSIAYRFAKKRRMYITLPTTFRMSIEIISIVLSILLLIMFDERSLKTYISQNPIDSGLWIGIIIAYFVMVVHNNKNDDISYKKQGENKNDTGQSNVAVAENSIHLEAVNPFAPQGQASRSVVRLTQNSFQQCLVAVMWQLYFGYWYMNL